MIRVVIADGQSLFREAVKVVLSSQDDLMVVGEATDGLQAVAEVERTVPMSRCWMPICRTATGSARRS